MSYKVQIQKTKITNPGRKYDYYAEIWVYDGIHKAKFITHGEKTLDRYRFSEGVTSNGVRVWTRHDRDFNSDFNFLESDYLTKDGNWGRRKKNDAACADLMDFINSCHGLILLHPEGEQVSSYNIENGKVI